MGQAMILIGVVFWTVAVIGESPLAAAAGGALCSLGVLAFWAEAKYDYARVQLWRKQQPPREKIEL